MIAGLITAVLIVIVDQVTKALLYGMSQSLIGDFLWLESTLNTGASFGMMQNGTIFFIIMSIPVIIAMIYIICSKKYLNNFNKICLSVILGGTVGNLIDRIFLGGVRDFIYFKSIGFAIFNVADIAITVGVIMFIIGLLVQIYKKEKKGQLSEPAKQENSERLEGLKNIRDDLKNSIASDEKSEKGNNQQEDKAQNEEDKK